MESLYASSRKEWNETTTTRNEREGKGRKERVEKEQWTRWTSIGEYRPSRRRFTKRDCPAKRLVLDGKVGGLTGGQAGRGRQAGRQGRQAGSQAADRQTEGKAMHFMIEYSEQRSRGRLLCIACLNHKLTAVYVHTFPRPRCKLVAAQHRPYTFQR